MASIRKPGVQSQNGCKLAQSQSCFGKQLVGFQRSGHWALEENRWPPSGAGRPC